MSDNDDALVERIAQIMSGEDNPSAAASVNALSFVRLWQNYCDVKMERESLTADRDKWRKIAGDALALLDKCFDELGGMDDQSELRGQIMELEEAYRTGESE